MALFSSVGWIPLPGVGPGVGFPMWDTLAVAVALDPSLVETERMRLRVRTDSLHRGQVEIGRGAPVQVAVDVKAEVFKERVFSALERM